MCVCLGIADEPLLMLSAPPELFLLFPVKGAYMVQWIVRGCNHKRFEMLSPVDKINASHIPCPLNPWVAQLYVTAYFVFSYVYMCICIWKLTLISFPFSVQLFILNFNSHFNISTIK